MSDTSQGEGWWLASDGKWYPPQSATYVAPPPPQTAYLQPPKKPLRKRVWFWLLLIVIVFAGGCTAIVIGAGTAVDHAAHVNHTIVYSVTGTGTANDVTYDTLQEGNGQSGEAQETNVTLPWTKTIHASGLVRVYSLGATVGSSGGSVTCSITEDGKLVSHNTAVGAFASAQCSGSGK
jgi:hypothetical protein